MRVDHVTVVLLAALCYVQAQKEAQPDGGSGTGETGATAVPDGDTSGDMSGCKDTCTIDEHGDKYALPGCTKYCKCAPKLTNTDSSTEYYWQIMPCPNTTLFDNALGICNHAQDVECDAQPDGGSGTGDTGATSKPGDSTGGPAYTTAVPDGDTSGDMASCKDTCTIDEHGDKYALPGCTKYCKCAPKLTNTDSSTEYYWQIMPCPDTTLFDNALGICNHAHDVECDAQPDGGSPPDGGSGTGETGATSKPGDSTGGPDYTTAVPDGDTSGDMASCKDTCTIDEHGDKYALPGCTKYCKCAPKLTNTDSSTEYYWQIMPCPDTTLFDNALGICNHAQDVECDAQPDGGSDTGDTGETSKPGDSTGGPDYTTAVPDGDTSGDMASCRDTCTIDEHGDKYALPGCTKYCKCAPKVTNTDSSTEYYWQIMPCPDTTLFDNALGICNHAQNVECDALSGDGSGTGKTDPSPEPEDSTDKPDPNYSGSGDTPDDSGDGKDDDKGDLDLSDATDAISKFLGFKCPKGYRCLPVLECIPCDYGSYKSTETSDLCKLCPAGCTTLRKGAKSWKECVPKCPPGYEQSECGKTCTKCRPGYFKSSWKNVKCHMCPSRSKPDTHTIGMKRMRECFAQGGWNTTAKPQQTPIATETNPAPETTALPEPEATSAGSVGGCNTTLTCDHNTGNMYSGDADCKGFCQCTTSSTDTSSQVSYYWEHHDCATGTLFNKDLNVCDHSTNVNCNALEP